MISLDVKTDSKSTISNSSIVLPSSDKESTLSFSELLKGVNNSKDDKIIQNGSLLLSLEADEKTSKSSKSTAKNDTLLNLLKNDATDVVKQEEPLTLNPKLTTELSSKEIKVLVSDAKEYLKSKILQSDDYKKSQIKDLPKTLKGLVEVAKKIGLDISKISVEEVRGSKESQATHVKQESLNKLTIKDISKLSTDVTTKNDTKESAVKTIVDALNIKEDIKAKPAVKTNETSKAIDIEPTKSKDVSEAIDTKVIQAKSSTDTLNPKIETKPESKLQAQQIEEVRSTKENVSTKDIVQTKEDTKPQTTLSTSNINKKSDIEVKNTPVLTKDETSVDTKKDIPKEIKSTPLFKAQTKVELTTEQIVQTKANSSVQVEVATPKQRANETLKLLLRGEKPQVSTSTNLTADFSVATAKVLAPSAQTQAQQSLEKLLKGENSESKAENVTSSKTDGLTASKADSFEVKINEAKQMVKYLSSDVKTAIEDYKSPFTRIKVQLNPQKLGDVDLTVVQRGNNLHVSLSSNNAAINTLAMNVNELRTQLNNNGINNASFNFNSNSDSNNQNGSQQQQNRQNEQKAHEEYNYFDNGEQDEEILSSLEIVVPRYI